jgi:hypothetical protein
MMMTWMLLVARFQWFDFSLKVFFFSEEREIRLKIVESRLPG